MQKSLDRKAKTRVRIAFLFLFVFVVALSYGAYFITSLSQHQETMAAQESQAALQGISDPRQLDEALKQHPSNKILQMIAMATKAANETSTATEKLSYELEPPTLPKNIDLGKASRAVLEAFRRDLKTAEANTTAMPPRYAALIKTERDQLETYALSLHAGKDIVGRFLDEVDRRHAKNSDLNEKIFLARADYYRAYERYVAVLVAEFGAYKVVDGQFIFPLQPTVNRYNAAANAMTAAGKRVTELEQERTTLMQSQQQGWEQIVSGK